MSRLCRRLCRRQLLHFSSLGQPHQKLLWSLQSKACSIPENNVKKVSSITEVTKKKFSSDADVEDFLGLNGGPDVINVESDSSQPDAVKKYEYLFNRRPKPTEEKVFITTFGSIRYDVDNPPHRFEVDLPEIPVDMTNASRVPGSTNFIEDQYFEGDSSQEIDSELQESDRQIREIPDTYINKQYFSTANVNSSRNSTSLTEEPPSVVSDLRSQSQSTGNYVDDMYFTKLDCNSDVNMRLDRALIDHEQKNAFALEDSVEPAGNEQVSTNSDTLIVKPTTKSEVNFEEKLRADVKNPKTAYDYVMKLRAEKNMLKKPGAMKETLLGDSRELPFSADVDSQGFRSYKNQVNDLENEPEMIVLQILKHSVLYNDNEIVALSKPYGLPSHHGAGHHHCLTKFLPDLAKYLDKGDSSELFTVHRLDKETTGVILLAKTQTMARILHSMLAEGKILKTYWAITKGVPEPGRGVVDIPMAESVVNGKSRMVLRPDYNEDTKLVIKKKSMSGLHPAVTKYSILASAGNAALVELQPTTGVKHQLRVHLASALNCPVLGDHKYSHDNKLAPQKLPSDMLDHLRVRQSKVRNIPMHLHARSVVIPEILDGRNIHIGAKLPKYFETNMRRLKIKLN